jgi:hypothetical protein
MYIYSILNYFTVQYIIKIINCRPTGFQSGVLIHKSLSVSASNVPFGGKDW